MPQRKSTKAKVKASSKAKVFLKKGELSTVATRVYNQLAKNGKVTAAIAGRKVGLTPAFFSAVKNLLPPNRQPSTLSPYMRDKLISCIKYRHKQQLSGAAPARDPITTKPQGVVIKVEGMAIEVESHADAAAIIRELGAKR